MPSPTPSPPTDDFDLVRRVQAGDAAARDEFLERARIVPRVISAKNRSSGNPLGHEAIRDVVQDVFLEMQRRLPEFPEDGILDRWIYHFCVFVFLNRARSAIKARAAPLIADVAEPTRESGEFHALDLVAVREGLGHLTRDERDLVRWRFYDDLTLDQMAARLGAPAGTVKTRFYKALERLRRHLGPRFEGRPVAGRDEGRAFGAMQ